MRTWGLALILLAPALAGCIGSDEALEGADLPEAPVNVDRVVSFTGDGTILPLPGEIGTPAAFLTGHSGAEPNIGITSSGAIFISAFEEVVRSTDGGETWEPVWALGLEHYGAPVDPIFNSDPMLWVDTYTDRVYNVPMFPILLCSDIVWSDDDGDSWTERPMACGIPYFDHQKFATGPPSANAPPMAGVAYENVAYLCYGEGAYSMCKVSYDGGLTWPIHRPVMGPGVDGSPMCASQMGHPTIREDGVVAIAKSWNCDALYIVVSEDSGLTWTVKKGPEGQSMTIDPEIAFTEDGTLYAMWQRDDYLTYVARSSDLGDTWEGPWVISPPDVKSTKFAALAAGDDGRIAAAFVGTRDTDEHPSEAPEDARWYLYIVTSENANAEMPEFTAYQATPDEDPVQIGCVWHGGGGGGERSCRNMLDFIDATIAPDGTFHVAFTDGCTDGCAYEDVDDEMDSRDRQAGLARLDGFVLRTMEQPTEEERAVAGVLDVLG